MAIWLKKPSNPLNTAILDFVACCNIPFGVVNHPSFRTMLDVAVEQGRAGLLRYPNRQTIATTTLGESYAIALDYIAKELGNDSPIAITTDGWVSKTLQSFWSLTLHSIDDSWRLHHVVAGCPPIYEKSLSSGVEDASALASVLLKVLEGAKIPISRVVACVTDEGGAAHVIPRQMNQISTESSVELVPCAAHRLNTVLRNAFIKAEVCLPLVVIALCKRLATHLHHSDSSNKLLADLQLRFNESTAKIPQIVTTRFNSKFGLLDAVSRCPRSLFEFLTLPQIQQKLPVSVTLLLNKKVQAELKSLVVILREFKLLTDRLSRDKIPTIDKLIISLEKLRHMNRTCFEDVLDPLDFLTPACCTIANLIADELDRKFSSKYTDMELMALALNPGNYVAFEDPLLANYFAKGIELLRRRIPTDVEYTFAVDNPQTTQTMETEAYVDESSFWDKRRITPAPSDELELFLTECKSARPGDAQDILLWWKARQPKFPRLATIARAVLAIPASQTTSERLFSVMRRVYTDGRSQLDPEKAEKLVVIKSVKASIELKKLEDQPQLVDAERDISQKYERSVRAQLGTQGATGEKTEFVRHRSVS